MNRKLILSITILYQFTFLLAVSCATSEVNAKNTLSLKEEILYDDGVINQSVAPMVDYSNSAVAVRFSIMAMDGCYILQEKE